MCGVCGTPTNRKYILFCWDNIFASFTAGVLGYRDAAYSNLIQIVRAKTNEGYVPNWAAGGSKNTVAEPAVGGRVLLDGEDDGVLIGELTTGEGGALTLAFWFRADSSRAGAFSYLLSHSEYDWSPALNIYLTDMENRPDFGKARSEYFSGRMPCSTLVALTALAAPGALVEIEAGAFLGAGT